MAASYQQQKQYSLEFHDKVLMVKYSLERLAHNEIKDKQQVAIVRQSKLLKGTGQLLCRRNDSRAVVLVGRLFSYLSQATN